MATPVKGRAPTPGPPALTPKLPALTPKLPDLSGEIIAVRVGDEIIYVHERLISNSSGFFQKATKPEWKTGPRPIDLFDEMSSIFKKYCQWLYTGRIATECLEKHDFRDFARMYVLGERFVDYEFQNAVINAIVSCMIRWGKVPCLRSVIIIYRGTTKGSVARHLLVDIWAEEIDSSWTQEGQELLEPVFKDFLTDLFAQILQKRLFRDKTEGIWIPQPELYHQKVVALRSSVVEKKVEKINNYEYTIEDEDSL